MTSYRPAARTLLCVSFVLLAGCATPYQRYGTTGGFQDVQLAPDLFRVAFLANAFTSAQQAYDYALLRGAELAVAHGFTHIALVDESSSQSQMAYYNEFLQSYQYFYKPGTTLLIRAFCGAPSGVYSLDAGFVAEQLRRSYGITATPVNSVSAGLRSERSCRQIRASP